jgi:hypothetical protein
VVNEYDSGKYDEISGFYDPLLGKNLSVGELVLKNVGFVDRKGAPYTFEWAGYALLFSLMICIMAVIMSTIASMKVRFATGKSLSNARIEEAEDEDKEVSVETALPFQKVNLTFKDIRYTVTSSIGKEKIELLKGIDGVFEAGKMTALVSFRFLRC